MTVRLFARPGRARALAVVLVTALGACSSSSRPPAASVPPSTAARPAPQVASGLRGQRYCEILLVHPGGQGALVADVYSTYPLNTCPPGAWAALDMRAIAARAGVPIALRNGPRYWLMDRIERSAGPTVRGEFGALAMNRYAVVVVGPLAQAMRPYLTHAVHRSTVFSFATGSTVYELRAANGTRYVMQSWSQEVDPALAQADLAALGSRLHLPAGWSYLARHLDAPLRVVTTAEDAEVLQDDLKNSYSLVPGS